MEQSGHVETVVLLSQKNPDDKIEFTIETGKGDVTKAEKVPRHIDIKKFVEAHHDVKISDLYISQIKKKCGLPVGQSYNKSKKPLHRVPQCPPDKEEYIIEAFKHFGLIDTPI